MPVYLRLKNAQIGYNVPLQLVKNIEFKIEDLYQYTKPFDFTKMRGGWDPEYTADGSGRAYPVSSTYSVGLNIKF